ncbi:hypothetical protein GCM10023189_14320 [Nibrella saemangeumensis]|uniref:DUF11 domain-containing protein n=1 Tax=Nibrella saemangeumensis TaxID=1084526 RepID=A0ABP8MJU4_9BACT
MKETSTLTIVPHLTLSAGPGTRRQAMNLKSILFCLTAFIGTLFSVGAMGQAATADLSLRKQVSNSRPQLNDVISYTLVVRNSGPGTATNVTIRDQLPAGGTQFVSSNALRGSNTFSSATGMWTVGTVAPNDSAVLVISTRVLERGVWFNIAEVMTASPLDTDSQPGNGNLLEDDYASVCFSVPVFWYPGDEFTISIPTGYTGIRWFRNGQQIGTAAVSPTLAMMNPDSSLLIRSPGIYTFQTTRNGCVSGNCCDIEIIQGPYGSIGDFVFRDLNENGLQDDGPNTGVAGVQVALYTATGTNPLRTILTDANGFYRFDSLQSGTYRVRFIAPSGQQFTTANAGANDAIDSDAGPDGFTGPITINAEQPANTIGRTNNTVDAGLRPVTGPCNVESPPIVCVVPNICVGGSTQITAIGCANGTIRWSDGQTGSTITVSPQTTTTYSASCVIGACVSNSSNLIVVNVVNPQPPTIVASSTAICAGDSVRLTALGCEGGTIQWSEGGQSGRSILVRPQVNTTYTAICRQANCLSTPATVVINVGANLPKPTVVCSLTQVCPGEQVTLSVVGCDGIPLWSTGQTTSSITVTPTVGNNTYYVECRRGNCVSPRSDNFIINIANPTVPTIAVSSSTICVGGTVSLTATGCNGTVTWSNGMSGSVISMSLNASQTFTAQCRIGNCLSNPSVGATVNVVTPAAPTITVQGSTLVCAGDVVNLSTTSSCLGGTIVWSNGATGQNISLVASATQDVFAYCQIGSCRGAESNRIRINVTTVGTPPTVTASSLSVCAGSSVTLTAANCTGNVIWSNGQTGSSIVVTPTAQLNQFSAVCRVGTCGSPASNTVTITITPGAVAPPTVTASSLTVCAGNSVTLTAANCAGSVIWSNGQTGSSIVVTPTAQLNQFSAVCRVGTCNSPTSNVVQINLANPNVPPTVTASSLTTCAGSSVTLTAANCAGTVMWSNGQTGTSIVVTPTAQQNQYSAMCQAGAACTSPSSNTVTITITPGAVAPPIVTATSPTGSASSQPGATSSLTVCAGTSVTMTAAGCTGTVVWSNGQTGASIIVTPTAQQSQFTAVCQSACTSPASNPITVIVVPVGTPPTITASSLTTCAGSSVTLTVANCAGTVVWSNGQTGASIVVAPTAQQNQYSAVCRVGACSSPPSNTVQITILPELPKPTVVCSATQVCPGGELTLTVVGCVGTPIWSTGQTTTDIIVRPVPGNNTYSVVCRQGACTSPRSDNYTIDIANPVVPAIAASSSTICVGGTVSLTASGCSGAVSWSNGQTGSVINVTLTANQTFYAQCRVGSCLSNPSNGVTVNVANPATPTITVQGSTLVCAGDVVNLSTTSSCPGGTIVWSNGATGQNISLVASATQQVFARCQVGGCQSAESNRITINVNNTGTPPTITASSLTVCNGGTVTLNAANCAGTVVWSNGQTGTSITVSPTPQQNQFSAICRVGTSCGSLPSNVVQIAVTTRPRPTVICSAESVCPGQFLTLIVQNCDGTPEWNTGQTTSSIVVSPTTTTTYNVVCRNGQCVSDRSQDYTITVNQTPRPTITASSTLVTAGSSVTLTATGCPGTVTWSNGMTGSSIVVPLQIDQSFVAFCRSQGCLGEASSSIAVSVRGGTTQPQNQSASIGVALALVARDQLSTNTYRLRYRATVQNFGNVPLTGVQIMGDLANSFAAPTSFSVIGAPVVRAGSNLVVNPAFTGRPTAGTELLLPASRLNVGERDSVFIVVNVVLAGNQGPFFSSVLATGYTESPVTLVQDQSNNGFDPNPVGNTPTPVRFDVPTAMLGVAKAVSTPVPVPGSPGVYDLTYTIRVTNLGTEDLSNVQVSDNLAQNYGSGVLIVSNPISVSTDAGFTPNAGFTGQGLLINMLNSNLSNLPRGATRSVRFTVRINVSNANRTTFNNTAIAMAQTAGGTMVRDTSTAGSNADPDNDLDPRNNSQPTQIVLTGSPLEARLGVAKSVKDTVRQANGSYDVTYQIVVKNYGSDELTHVQLTDSLNRVFNTVSGATFTVVGPPQASSNSKLIVNSGFNGSSDTRLVIGESLSILAAGQADTVLFRINVVTDGRSNTFLNSVYGVARAGTTTVIDVSTDGLDPDPNGNEDPTEVTESEATPLSLPATTTGTVFVPGGFSPNGDGINDTFVISGTEGLTVSLEVYNRWGHLVYKSDDYKNDWDGRSNTGVQVGNATGGLPEGTYYYVVRLSDGREYVKYLTINR